MQALKQRKTEQVVLRLTPDEREAIERQAAKQRRTLADTVRLIVVDALAATHGEAEAGAQQ